MRIPQHKTRTDCIAAMNEVLQQALLMVGYKEPRVGGGNAACGKGYFGDERLGDQEHCSWSVPLGKHPHTLEAHKNCGWPLVWKVTRMVMGRISCGNSCNSQFYYPDICLVCGRVAAVCRRCKTATGDVEMAEEALDRSYAKLLCPHCKEHVDTVW